MSSYKKSLKAEKSETLHSIFESIKRDGAFLELHMRDGICFALTILFYEGFFLLLWHLIVNITL